ncbi:hypothetical protein [Streptomyces sp. NPDC050738]|uniref:hypothetical protein n=1 Tax=Streptomyces sp. NPDC050738 TaxID=3154744 RepID=UPI0034486F43
MSTVTEARACEGYVFADRAEAVHDLAHTVRPGDRFDFVCPRPPAPSSETELDWVREVLWNMGCRNVSVTALASGDGTLWVVGAERS